MFTVIATVKGKPDLPPIELLHQNRIPEPVLTGHFRFPVTESCRRWGWGSPRSPRPWTRWTGSAGCKPDRRWCRLKLPPKVSSQLEAEIIFWASWRGRFVLRITVVYSLARVAEWQNHIDKISYLKSKFFECAPQLFLRCREVIHAYLLVLQSEQ